MRVAFYLPAVTPWWFDNIIAPLVRVMARACEVHVLVPPMWKGTGIGPEQLHPFADETRILWYVLDGPGHQGLRISSAQEELLDLVHTIDPDLVLCRSAEPAVADLFPGEVRFIMEGAMPPLRTGQNWIAIQPDVLSYGRMPYLEAEKEDALLALFMPHIESLKAREAAQPHGRFWRERAGIASGRKVVALPLEYEHEENFFALHRQWPSNADWIADIARRLHPDIFLAVTDHPLNLLHGDSRAVKRVLAGLEGRAALIGPMPDGTPATAAIARNCDGAILDMSKSWGQFTFHGKPIFRRSHLYGGPWLRLHEDLDAFGEAVLRGESGVPFADAALWFAYHAANNLIDPCDPALRAEDIIDHAVNPVNPARWQRNIARLDAFDAVVLPC